MMSMLSGLLVISLAIINMITIFTDKFIPERFGALNLGPFSLVRNKYKDDMGVIAHENLHTLQWLKLAAIGPVSGVVVYFANIEIAQPYLLAIMLVPALFHGLLYKFSDWYRLKSEVAAYKEQQKHYADDRTDGFADYLITKYDLNLTKEDAVKGLRS